MAETVKTAQRSFDSRATRELARRVIALFSLARAARDCAMPQSVEARLRGALWGLFAGDAVASLELELASTRSPRDGELGC